MYLLAGYQKLQNNQDNRLGIVFGAGITHDKEPNSILKDRLDIAGQLYKNDDISQILVSGNNDEGYDETDVMSQYLISEYQVPLEDIITDGYGYRTYDTCQRANEIYSIESATLITTGYHLARAVYLCEKLGIDSVGVSSTLNEYYQVEYYYLRELLANSKALIDLYIIIPTTSNEFYPN